VLLASASHLRGRCPRCPWRWRLSGHRRRCHWGRSGGLVRLLHVSVLLLQGGIVVTRVETVGLDLPAFGGGGRRVAVAVGVRVAAGRRRGGRGLHRANAAKRSVSATNTSLVQSEVSSEVSSMAHLSRLSCETRFEPIVLSRSS